MAIYAHQVLGNETYVQDPCSETIILAEGDALSK